MNYELHDSSGTDDDLPHSQRNRFASVGLASANGRSAAMEITPFLPIQNDMETQIHHIEQEAYSSVLRAFKAQSDAITWEKESLITELRKELRVSDEEHRELLSRVNTDDIIRRIREWRASGAQPSMRNSALVRDPLPSPTVSASRKKQKTSQSIASLSMGAPSPVLQSSSVLKRGPGARGKRPKSHTSTALRGTGHIPGRGSAGGFGLNESAELANFDTLVGRKVWTRWPEDNSFYEAVITDYNPDKGLHALVYDINTADETWEWVNLKEISLAPIWDWNQVILRLFLKVPAIFPHRVKFTYQISSEDLRWEGDDPGISHRGGHSGSGRGFKNSMARGGSFAGGRGRGIARTQPGRDFPPSQNGIGRQAPCDIEILHTDTLLKEVEKVFSASRPDPMEIEKAKKVLKDHEQALIDAIARLEDASDVDSDRRGHQFSQGPHYNETGKERRVVEGSDGTEVAREARMGSDQQDHRGGML